MATDFPSAEELFNPTSILEMGFRQDTQMVACGSSTRQMITVYEADLTVKQARELRDWLNMALPAIPQDNLTAEIAEIIAISLRKCAGYFIANATAEAAADLIDRLQAANVSLSNTVKLLQEASDSRALREKESQPPAVARWRCVSYCRCEPAGKYGHFERDDEAGVWVKHEDLRSIQTKTAHETGGSHGA